jgi:hypothetical protein
MEIRVADEAWIATALLHREHPEAEDFALAEIRKRAERDFHDERPGVWYHIVSHCVASNPRSPAQYRMLHETTRGRRRLYRPGDPTHPERKGKTHPDKDQLPTKYRPLVDWYLEDYIRRFAPGAPSSSPAVLLKFVGAISAFDLQKMSEAISSGCERVDRNEW